ncbi:hypothetical protein ABPG77_000537 [Micractinium sp. CCAP 211/92]
MDHNDVSSVPVRKRSGSSGRRRPRSSDAEAVVKKPRRGGLAAAIQKYITVRPTDPLIQEILPTVEAPARTERPPASGDQAASTGQSSAAAGIVSSKPESGQQGKAPTPPLLTPTKQERPTTAGSTVLPEVGRVAIVGARGGPRDKPAAGVSAGKDAAWPAEELPSGAEHAQPAEASPAGLVKQRQPTAAAAAAAGRPPAAAAAVPSSPAGLSVLSPSSKACKAARRQEEPCCMVASPPPAPPPPPSSTGGGLARRPSDISTKFKFNLQQPTRTEPAAESRAASAGWRGADRQGRKGRQAKHTAAQPGQRSGLGQNRPAAETFVLQATGPPEGSCDQPRSEEASGAVQLIAKLFESSIFGGSLPAQQQHQQQQHHNLLPVPVAVLPPGLPPLSLQLMPLQHTVQYMLQGPQVTMPTVLQQQLQQQQQQQHHQAPTVDSQLAQQALRVLDSTPQALMLGSASVAGLGSSPMLTPLALMLMDHGSSQPAPAAALEPGLPRGDSWPPALAVAGAMGGAVVDASAAAQTPCTALLSALLGDGPPTDEAESAKLEEMLQRGDFSIESLLGSLPATPALAAASVGPATAVLPAGPGPRPQSGEPFDPALGSGCNTAAAAAAPGPVSGPTASLTAQSPQPALPLLSAVPGVFMNPRLLAGAGWARMPPLHVPATLQPTQQPLPSTPPEDLQRAPTWNQTGPEGSARLGRMAAGLASPSQGLMSPSAVAEWLA